MAHDTYNGWTNRATWLINVWFNPESREDVESAREQFEDAVNSADIPDLLRDFIDQDINRTELLDHFEEESEEVEAD
jgi:hypothetical protein